TRSPSPGDSGPLQPPHLRRAQRSPVKGRLMKKAPTHLRLAALVVAIAAATAACGGGKSKTQAKPAAAVSSTTLDPEAAIRAEVLAAFAEYRKFYVDAIAKPDPRDPALEAHLTGSALTAMQRDQV